MTSTATVLIVILSLAVCSSGAIDSRIVGGIEAEPHSLPYQVAIFVYDELYCDGSLISENFVLTAALCLRDKSSITLKFGVHDLTAKSPCQLEQGISHSNFIVEHLLDEHERPLNDLALIKLNFPVSFNECIKPINLPRLSDKENKYVGDTAIASGWRTNTDQVTAASVSNVLGYVNVTVIDNIECGKHYGDIVTSCRLCTSGEGIKGTCSGDDGGPLAIEESDGSKTLIGVTLFGYYLCEAQKPSVYVRVTSMLDWIVKNSDVKL